MASHDQKSISKQEDQEAAESVEKAEVVEVSACGDHTTNQISQERKHINRKRIYKTPNVTVKSVTPHACQVSGKDFRYTPWASPKPKLYKKLLRPQCLFKDPETPSSESHSDYEHVSTTAKKKRAVSLVDIPIRSPTNRVAMSPLRQQLMTRINSVANAPTPEESIRIKAAQRICQLFLLNSWRHKRRDNAALSAALDNSKVSVENLQLQIIVLRNLMSADNERADAMKGEIQRYKVLVEGQGQEKEALLKENARLSEQLSNLNGRCESQMIAWKNVKNELQSSRELEAATDLQLQSERDKAAKLREEQRSLLDKMESQEGQFARREKQLLQQIEEMQGRLTDNSDEKQQRIDKLGGIISLQWEQISDLVEELASRPLPAPREPSWPRKVIRYMSGTPLLFIHEAASKLLPAFPSPQKV